MVKRDIILILLFLALFSLDKEAQAGFGTGTVKIRVISEKDTKILQFHMINRIILYHTDDRISLLKLRDKNNREFLINFGSIVYFERDLDDQIPFEVKALSDLKERPKQDN
jgi:hypothetical protein